MVHQIAIVEDDIAQQGNYADALQRRGYETLCYASVDEAMAGISANPPSLVLLDVVLGDHPDGGFDICRGLLNQGIDTPVVFLSDRTEEIDRAFGLRIAWDYLTKPISLMLLAERIANVLRISTARQNNTDPIPPIRARTLERRCDGWAQIPVCPSVLDQYLLPTRRRYRNWRCCLRLRPV